MSNSFGTLFKITTFGESHGKAVGAVLDGCPARLPLSEADIQPQLDRRRPGQSTLVSPRQEKDLVSILAGVDQGKTLGAPIALLIENHDQRPADYAQLAVAPRPSHADLTYRAKYGITALSGGGRASARETIGRVAGGAVAEKFLKTVHKVDIVAWVSAVGAIDAPELTAAGLTRAQVDSTAIRCPDPETAQAMIAAIAAAQQAGDSLGGVISCVCRNIPAGWGEPVFDKLSALLAQAMLSIPAAKGFEIGSGFAGARLRGSQHNDLFIARGQKLTTATNRSGGIQGGLSNGEPIVFRVAFKPPASIAREQQTVTYDGQPIMLAARGRHDPCVVARAVPIVEAMAALVLADSALRHCPPLA